MGAPGVNRLRWRCRRGMLELDVLLQAFLHSGYADLDDTGRVCFDRLLAYPDPTLLELLMGRMVAADKELMHVVEGIRRAAVTHAP